MRILGLLVFGSLVCAWAQPSQTHTPAVPLSPATVSTPSLPDLPEQTVIAVFDDGTQFTMGDFKRVYGALPPQNQQMALRDRLAFLQQWALMRRLARMAEEQKLEQQSPTKETLDYYRMMILSQAKLEHVLQTTTVDPSEIVKFYDANKDKYKQVRVKAIYIAFGSTPDAAGPGGKKLPPEDQAKARASRLLTQIRGGADFIKLVKENSDDETSRDKDGDFATLRPNDNVPDAVRAAVFALRQGEVSEPVRQAGGYYLLRAEEITYRPLSQVRDEIFSELKQQQYGQWLEQANRDTKVKFTSTQFLGVPQLAVPQASR